MEKDILGYEGLYTITDKGEVYSLGNGNSTCPSYKTKRKITLKTTKTGYIHCKLFKDGVRRHYAIHRLVAINFIQNPENKREVNHKDGNKANNCVSNLEWATSSENQKHAFANNLQKRQLGADSKCSKKVAQINLLDGSVIKVWDCINMIKREIGYNSFGIIGCCKNKPKYKTAYGYRWSYV
jgi:hypothetical protein